MARQGQSKKTGSIISKKHMRRQTSPVLRVAPANLPMPQGGDNMVMVLLMDLSSRMSATEEFIAKHRETEIRYPPVRAVCWEAGNLQLDWQPATQALIHKESQETR